MFPNGISIWCFLKYKMSVLHRIHYIIASIVTLIHFVLTGLQTLIADMDKNKAEITVLMFLRVRVLYALFHW